MKRSWMRIGGNTSGMRKGRGEGGGGATKGEAEEGVIGEGIRDMEKQLMERMKEVQEKF